MILLLSILLGVISYLGCLESYFQMFFLIILRGQLSHSDMMYLNCSSVTGCFKPEPWCRVCRDWPLTAHNLAVEATSQMLRLVWWPVVTSGSVTRDHGTMGRWRGGRTNWITLSTWYFLPQPPGRYTGERVIRSITSQYNYGSLSTSICYLDSVCHTYPLAKTKVSCI